MTQSLTYDSPPSAGESMIAREMREQREREDELRCHWKELGMEVGSQEPPDTPFNRPDPHPATNRAFVPRSASGSLAVSYQKDVRPFKADQQQPRRGSVESADSSRGSSDRLENSRAQVRVDSDICFLVAEKSANKYSDHSLLNQ